MSVGSVGGSGKERANNPLRTVLHLAVIGLVRKVDREVAAAVGDFAEPEDPFAAVQELEVEAD